MLRTMGLEPGAEFKAGIEEADKIGEPLPLKPPIPVLFNASDSVKKMSNA